MRETFTLWLPVSLKGPYWLSLSLLFCLSCVFAHLLSQYQSDSEPRPPSCQEHPRQPLNMYCVQNRKLICGLCLTVGQHQGHPIDDLQAAFIREKRTPSLLLARLSEHRWAQVRRQIHVERKYCVDIFYQYKYPILPLC